jgi:hypothetical protein
MSLVQYDGKQVYNIKRVWYNGTSKLIEGQAICYDVLTGNAVLPVSLGGAGASPTYLELGQVVTDPATATLLTFAGVVASTPSNPASAIANGIGHGPGWIDIIQPARGDIIDLYCKENVTTLSTLLGITNAGGLNFVSVSDSTINTAMVAVALMTIDRSTTPGLVRCKVIY